MVSNPGYYSQMATAGSLTQIEDGVDNPHTGLIKALSLGVAGNYVISGFDATSVTATSATIAAGVVLRDGERVAITGSGVSLSTTYTTGYHLLVARSSALAVINPAAANKVPAFTAGDVPIAILAHTGSSPMQIQYFGTGKTENSLSIAQPTSGTAAYTEEGKISAPSGASGQGIDIVTTSTNSDIRITPNGDGKIVLDGLNWPIADGNTGEFLKTNGSNQLSFSAVSIPASPAIEDNSGTPVLASGITETEVRSLLNVEDSDFVNAVEAESTLDLTGDVTIADKKFTVDTTTLVVNAPSYTNKVGIGTATPNVELEVNGDIKADRLEFDSTKEGFNTIIADPVTQTHTLSDTYAIYRVSSQPIAPMALTLPLVSSTPNYEGTTFRIDCVDTYSPPNQVSLTVTSPNVLYDVALNPITTPLDLVEGRSYHVLGLPDGWILTTVNDEGLLRNIAEDSTPQLGGDLDTNSNHIDFDTAHGIRDDSSNEQLIFNKTASAVNHFEITNAATSGTPKLSSAGGDTNIDIEIEPKGTGKVDIDGELNYDPLYFTAKVGSNTNDATLTGGSWHKVEYWDIINNETLTLDSATDGETFTVPAGQGGLYTVHAQVGFTGTNSTLGRTASHDYQIHVAIYKNGSVLVRQGSGTLRDYSAKTSAVSTEVVLAATDTLEIYFFVRDDANQSDTGTTQLRGGEYCRWSVRRVGDS